MSTIELTYLSGDNLTFWDTLRRNELLADEVIAISRLLAIYFHYSYHQQHPSTLCGLAKSSEDSFTVRVAREVVLAFVRQNLLHADPRIWGTLSAFPEEHTLVHQLALTTFKTYRLDRLLSYNERRHCMNRLLYDVAKVTSNGRSRHDILSAIQAQAMILPDAPSGLLQIQVNLARQIFLYDRQIGGIPSHSQNLYHPRTSPMSGPVQDSWQPTAVVAAAAPRSSAFVPPTTQGQYDSGSFSQMRTLWSDGRTQNFRPSLQPQIQPSQVCFNLAGVKFSYRGQSGG